MKRIFEQKQKENAKCPDLLREQNCSEAIANAENNPVYNEPF